jgi:hypothetical protein
VSSGNIMEPPSLETIYKRRQQNALQIAETQKRLQEGFWLAREVNWYPKESASKLVDPGGRYKAHVKYSDGGSIKYYWPIATEHEGPPASSAYEIVSDVFEFSLDVSIDLRVLFAGVSSGWIQAQTKSGLRGFYSSIREVRGQVPADANLVLQTIDAVKGVVDTVKDGIYSTVKYLVNGASAGVGGMKNCPVPSEAVGHICVVTQREGWFAEGSDMNDRYKMVWAKTWMAHDIYTVNYADYLTGKALWERWLRAPKSDREGEIYRRRAYANSKQPVHLRLPYAKSPWAAWADFHRYPITAPPPDVRFIKDRRQHAYREPGDG